MKTLKAVIVEDDPYFAKVFFAMLKKNNLIEVIKICKSGEQFIQELTSTLDFEVVFLDIQLPGIAGTEIGKKIKETRPKIQVVFVTGEATFAAEAFDIEATDYLVKPFDNNRLNRCINRLLTRMSVIPETITLRVKDSIICIEVDKLIFIEKVNKSTLFHTIDNTYSCSYTIESIYNELQGYGFIRTHKSYIVNPKHIKCVEKWADRSYKLMFHYGDKFALVSRTNKDTLKNILQNKVWNTPFIPKKQDKSRNITCDSQFLTTSNPSLI